MKISIFFFLALAIVIVQTSEAGIRSRTHQEPQVQNSRTNSRLLSGNIDNNSGKSSKNLKSENLNGKSGKGVGISAWGIIGIIVGAIIISTSGYYAFIFYPYLCKKERNYDMIELASVV